MTADHVWGKTMKTPKLLFALVFCSAILAGASAKAERFGHEDSHHVWHDAGYWHERHPEWVYRYHPDWAVERQEWWEADHQRHPEWFGSPFWQQYPVWTYGDYDERHVWHYSGWWHEHNPNWMYERHPGWAEAHPEWMRHDHEGHPEWFHSPYWQQNRHDWKDPGKGYRLSAERSVAYQQSRALGVIPPRNPEDHDTGKNPQNFGSPQHAANPHSPGMPFSGNAPQPKQPPASSPPKQQSSMSNVNPAPRYVAPPPANATAHGATNSGAHKH